MSDSANYDDGNIFRSGFVKTAFVTFLIVYFLYLVLSQAPASLAAWAVHKAAPNVWLTSAEGTMWNGIARGAQIDVGREPIPMGQLRWKLNPLSLLVLSPCVDFESDLVSGSFCSGIAGSYSVKDLSLDTPLAAVKDLLPIESAGQLSLQVIEADFTMKRITSLNAKASVQGMRINPLGDWVNLGAVAIQADGNGKGGVKAKIFDIDSPITIDMLADWTPGAETWNIGGTVKLKDESPELLRQGLPTVGQEVDKDTYKLQWP